MMQEQRSAWRARRNGTLAVWAALFVPGTALSADVKATYITIDVPGSDWTTANSINNQGVITGYYGWCNGSSVVGSFVRAADGSITTFNVLPCTGQTVEGTFAESINNKGALTGEIKTGGSGGYGFVRNADGRIRSFYATLNSMNSEGETRPTSINDKHVVTGYTVNAGVHGTTSQAFVRASDGKLTIFDPLGSTVSYGLSINDSGTVTGYYEDENGPHGFVRSPDGTITGIDPAGSVDNRAVAINDNGVITGYYNDSSEIDHGFVRAVDGTITSFTAFGSTQTTPMSINSRGAITGSYTTNYTFHGFVRAPDGTIRSFEPPGSVLTYPLAINRNGAITGYYEGSGGKEHGFLRIK